MSKDIRIIKNTNFKDKRGLLWTTWRKSNFLQKLNLIMINFLYLKRKTLRGFSL